MNWKVLIPRIALGSIFLFSGMNGFFNFLPSEGLSAGGAAFIDSLKEMGYFWGFFKAAEIAAGILLLFNVAGQLAVLILAPICLGIVFFHASFGGTGAWLGWTAVALEVVMLLVWKDNFLSLLKSKENTQQSTARPNAPEESLSRKERKRVAKIRERRQAYSGSTVELRQQQEMEADKPASSEELSRYN